MAPMYKKAGNAELAFSVQFQAAYIPIIGIQGEQYIMAGRRPDDDLSFRSDLFWVCRSAGSGHGDSDRRVDARKHMEGAAWDQPLYCFIHGKRIVQAAASQIRAIRGYI